MKSKIILSTHIYIYHTQYIYSIYLPWPPDLSLIPQRLEVWEEMVTFIHTYQVVHVYGYIYVYAGYIHHIYQGV